MNFKKKKIFIYLIRVTGILLKSATFGIKMGGGSVTSVSPIVHVQYIHTPLSPVTKKACLKKGPKQALVM